MERLLITGIDTVVGSNLAVRLADRFDILGLYDRHAIESSYLRTAAADEDRPAVEELARDWKPAWVIHCGDHSTASWDEPATEGSADNAARGAQWLSVLAASLRAELAVISSDAVFTGPRIFHEEDGEATGDSPQAQAALAVERALEGTPALIVRTHAYGWSPHDRVRGFAEQAYASLSSGGSFETDGLRHATPILAADLADLLLRAYELKLHGVYHLAGAERTSPFRFVRELAAACAFGAPRRWEDAVAEGDAARLETSLNSKRARRALVCGMPLLREGLSRFAESASQWHKRWRTSTPRAARQLVA